MHISTLFGKDILRCVNLDWLEVYVHESRDRFPCNADYYRKQGYIVKEREYGTRQYKEMFTLCDENENPIVEIRRNPAAGQSDFSGFVPESSHIRLPNWMCYRKDAVNFLRDFLLKNDYVFQSIFRIDVCYDFEYFDSGDQPSRFARRYLEGVFRKINQCKLAAYGEDTWNACAWESLSWGSRSSMVTTKMYNKTKELSSLKSDKPYIRSVWFQCGLVDNPVRCTKKDDKGREYTPEIWRIEFSMKSSAKNWLVIEDVSGKKVKKRAIPHNLSLFDSPDKLWQRFQDLAYHYFRFKYKEYKGYNNALIKPALESIQYSNDRELQRKDRCRDKVLFLWDKGSVFSQVMPLPPPSHQQKFDDVLLRRLRALLSVSSDMKIREACKVLIGALESKEIRRLTPNTLDTDARALQLVLRAKMGGDERSTLELFSELKELILKQEIF